MADDKIIIKTDSGEAVEASAPVIISASRSTDIPAFYAKWFFNRLEKGYCVWINPFNQRPHYVSFAGCKAIVFWTKNAAPIIPYLHILDELGIHYYFQFTLNDYEQEGLEPNLPPLNDRINTFRRLADLIGPDRVIWRFDPIVICPAVPSQSILAKVRTIGNQLKGYTRKLVFSFIDVKAYKKVRLNLVKDTEIFTGENVESAEGSCAQQMEVAAGIAGIRDQWQSEGWPLTVATCAESLDLGRYGIEHNCCIDGRLLESLFGDDHELTYYLHTGRLPEPSLFGEVPEIPSSQKNLKDKGQRKMCGCIVSKDIGMYNTCRHFCAYCYANTSRSLVAQNASRHSDDCESIIS